MTADSATVKDWALELGFAACGVTRPDPSARAEALDHWLDSGYGGTMRYIHRQAKKRKDPRRIDADARSVIVILDNYYYPDQGFDEATPKVAKYARGNDYHGVLEARLGRLADRLLGAGARVARPYADTGPVPERELAERAGLGWIGKNSMLIRPGAGSFFFIGSIFTDLDLEPDTPFRTDHCGSCTRCLDACPTSAFVGPRVLDATRCISYLTIEQKGPIPEPLGEQLSNWAFGCDICNDVCPWNQRFATPTTVAEYLPRTSFEGTTPDHFERMDEVEFARRYGDTPLARPGLAGMRRNFRAVHRRHHLAMNATTSPSEASMPQPFHFAFFVKDLDSARKFYGALLGCTEGRSADTWVDFDFFGNQISAHTTGTPAPPVYSGKVDGIPVPMPHFGALVDWERFQAVAGRAREAGIAFIIEPTIRHEGQSGEQATMFFLDPSGNALEFNSFRNPEHVFTA